MRYPSEYCPNCGAYERQRLLCLFLDRNPYLVAGDVLQVGPERSITDRYRSQARSWLAVDIDPAKDEAERRRCGLDSDDPIFVCRPR